MFDSARVAQRKRQCAQTARSAGSNPAPGTAPQARSTTAVPPLDKRQTRGSNPPAPTKRHEPNVFGSHYPWGDAGSTPAGRKLVAQWESAYAERDSLFAAFFTGRPSGRSAALQAVRRGFNSRPLHQQQLLILSPQPDWTRAPPSEGGGCRFESGRGYHTTWGRSSVAEHLNAITTFCSLLTSRRLMVTALNGVVARFESSPSPRHARTGVLRRRRAGSEPASRRFKSVPRFRR